jgi:hypothetical protein
MGWSMLYHGMESQVKFTYKAASAISQIQCNGIAAGGTAWFIVVHLLQKAVLLSTLLQSYCIAALRQN